MGDVGICHAHPSRPEVVGMMHYHGGHQWIGSYSPSHTISTSLFLHYYLTGDRRMREIGLEAWFATRKKPGLSRTGSKRLNREFSTPLLCLMEAYIDTWDRKYEDLARAAGLNWFLLTQKEPGFFPMSTYTRGERGDEAVVEPADDPVNLSAIVYPTFYEGLRHFDSPLLRKTVLVAADLVIAAGDLGDHRATFLSMAYDLTGNPVYAAYCKQLIEEYKAYARSTIEMKNIAFFSGIRNGHIAVLKATAARAMEKDPQAFAEAEKKLKHLVGKKPRNLGKPVSPTPQEYSLGIPAGYDK